MQDVRIYARVSTEEQAKKDTSIPAQVDSLKEYCDKNKMNILDTYIDNGISASSIKKRVELQRLLRDCKRGEIILFTKLDRLSRNILDANLIVQELNKKGVGIRAILESDSNIDTSSADGKFLFDLQVSLAERERNVVSERIKFAFEHKKAQKQPLGKVPFGYTLKDKIAVIDTEKAIIVKDTFNAYLSTRNITKTQHIINEKYNIQKGRSFYQKLLKKEQYTGRYHNQSDFFPQIINKETFIRCQKSMATEYTRTTKRSYIFSGITFCECGCRMNPTTTIKHLKSGDKRYKIYRCSSMSLAKGKCKNRISEMQLEQKVLTDFEPYLKAEVKINKSKPKEKKINRKEIENKIERLKTLYIDGIIEKKEFDIKYQSLQETLLDALKTTKNNKSDKKEIISKWDTIKNHYDNLSDDEKSIFWKSVINKIVVTNERDIEIFLY